MDIKTKVKTNRTVNLILFLGVIVVVNLISSNLFTRVDLTENKIYTLTDATKNVLKNLKDRVIVRAYFSEGLPAQYAEYRRIIKDKLDEYKVYAGDKLQYEFVDPSDSLGKERARADGIPQVRINVFENDQYTARNVYLGLVVVYEDKKEVLPVVTDISWLEYELTRAILKVSSPETYVGYVTSNGTPDMQKDVPAFVQMLRSQYNVMPVDLDRPVPKRVSTLVLLQPTEDLTDSQMYNLDRFVRRGGKLALFVDKIYADFDNGTARKLNLDNLDKLLANYNIKINNDIVLDRYHVQITVPQIIGSVIRFVREDYPFIPIVMNFDRTNPVVKDLENINLIVASSIDTSMLPNSGLKYSILARSSQYAYRMKDHYTISPNYQIPPEMYNESNIPLAVSLFGKFKGMFTDSSDTSAESPETKIVVVGDGDFVKDKFLGRDASKNPNMIFALNLVDWLTLSEGLISIRSREVTYRPLQKIVDGKPVEFTKAEKSKIKLMNILIPVSIVLIFGIIYFIYMGIRRKSEVVL